MGVTTRSVQSDERRDRLEVLAEHERPTPRDDRHLADSELDQFIVAVLVVEHVNGSEFDAPLRKKLFRSKTAASTSLGVENEHPPAPSP